MAAHYRSRLEGIMPNRDYDPTDERYRVPDSKPDQMGRLIAPLAVLAIGALIAAAAIGSGLWHPFG